MIRSYDPADWSAVRTIYDIAKPDEIRGSVPLDLILALDDDPEMLALFRASEIIVAEVEGEVAGFAGNKGNYIAWLFVHPHHRRRGIASALIRSVVARLDGVATLNVATGNTAARQLYERLGFVIEHQFEGRFRGHPCNVMRLRHEPSG